MAAFQFNTQRQGSHIQQYQVLAAFWREILPAARQLRKDGSLHGGSHGNPCRGAPSYTAPTAHQTGHRAFLELGHARTTTNKTHSVISLIWQPASLTTLSTVFRHDSKKSAQRPSKAWRVTRTFKSKPGCNSSASTSASSAADVPASRSHITSKAAHGLGVGFQFADDLLFFLFSLLFCSGRPFLIFVARFTFLIFGLQALRAGRG